MSRTITLAHGSGGAAMKALVEDVFVGAFGEVAREDAATTRLAELAAHGETLAFTTDSFVVTPLVFPGGDIGKLAVCGTVNDLATAGAVPLQLSCSVILEEGLEIALLRDIVRSMAETARQAGVRIVTGDTKVVPHGACDRLFVNTAGIGVVRRGVAPSSAACRPGDVVLVSGPLGDHGAAILAARGDLALETTVESDCAPLHRLVGRLLDAVPGTCFLRDATRGGLATVLNEAAAASKVGIELSETAVPVRDAVRGLCEILGLDPLYLANEGRMVAVVPGDAAEAALAALRADPLGREAALIGRCVADRPGRVVMDTAFGGRRIVDMLTGEQLPRIC
ncbi:hydrogenase expression/formation protein HypE [Falsiroseomonas oryzae]|uniref:hydrogenase expression/formation protein HypE n=1 Tax=Falsiroseomonas oryzae TaxID=2766473 RepID=UPI0022EAC6B9|nr:hydrogenase expression/formation protein HypE [Roseomonas sp. MO-31]